MAERHASFGTRVQIPFLVDEHLPIRFLLPILESRGHRATLVQVTSEDPEILSTAENTGGLVVTADHWFLNELFRYPVGHRKCYKRAGVIQVPGTWSAARLRLITYLPVIEFLSMLRSEQPDRRVAIDLSQREMRIREP
jgi:hypothetical protein